MQTTRTLPLGSWFRPGVSTSAVSTSLSLAAHGFAFWLAATMLVQPAIEVQNRVVVHLLPPAEPGQAGPAKAAPAAASAAPVVAEVVPPVPQQLPQPRRATPPRRAAKPKPVVAPRQQARAQTAAPRLATAPVIAPTPGVVGAVRLAGEGKGSGQGSGSGLGKGSGQGSGSGSGLGKGLGKGSGSGDGMRGVMASYFLRVRAAIEAAKRYPLMARRRGIEGRATVAFDLTARGTPANLVVESSDHPLLAAAARAAVESAAPLPAPPQERGAQPLRIQVPLRFALEIR